MMKDTPSNTHQNYRYRLVIGFTLFFLFFVYYMGVAILNTPEFRETAAILVAGIPLGMLLTLLVFPVSWLLVTIYFILWR